MLVGLALRHRSGLTGGGTAALVRRVHGWRRWTALPVGLLVVWFVLWPLTVALMATQVRPPRLGAGTPADRGMSCEDVAFTTRTACGCRPGRVGDGERVIGFLTARADRSTVPAPLSPRTAGVGPWRGRIHALIVTGAQ